MKHDFRYFLGRDKFKTSGLSGKFYKKMGWENQKRFFHDSFLEFWYIKICFHFKYTINKSNGMGSVCTAHEGEKETLQCPHRKKPKIGEKPLSINKSIAQPLVCSMCQHIKELKELNKSSSLTQPRGHLSLATQNQDEETDSTPLKKTNRTTTKTINDFEVVRGLGKGAFGRVYMIKQRQNQFPLAVDQDILSIKDESYLEEEPEQPEDIEFEMKIQSLITLDVKENKQENSNKKASKISLKEEETKSPNRSSVRKGSIRQTASPRFYALKIIHKNAITSNKEKKQAMFERYILQAMDHPFIVKLHYAFQTKSRLFLIVDLLPGGELFYLLRKMKRFNETIAKFYAAEILLAIEYLHDRSIIYRDLKPENILLDTEGHVKITDFGLSKVMYSSNQKTYSLCGTPEYMAPEVIQGKGYSQAADWFSFGSLIYDMLTGRPPFLNNNKTTMLKNICTKPVPLPYYLSSNTKSLLASLFQIDPEHRLGFREGASEIKKHPFFKDIDFDKLLQKKIQPPISFQDEMKQFVNKKDQPEAFVNSGGFQKWNSWHMNMESPDPRKTKESKQNFQGFTYELQDYELQYEEEEKRQSHQLPGLE